MQKQSQFTGQCLCGGVQFEVSPPTDFLGHCHCRSCQKSRGTAFVTWTSVPLTQFKWARGEEQVKWYKSSRQIEWGFCSHCGSQMLYRAVEEGHSENPKLDRVYISVGSLDGIDRVPTEHLSYEEKVPWYQVADKLNKYRGKGEELISEPN